MNEKPKNINLCGSKALQFIKEGGKDYTAQYKVEDGTRVYEVFNGPDRVQNRCDAMTFASYCRGQVINGII